MSKRSRFGQWLRSGQADHRPPQEPTAQSSKLRIETEKQRQHDIKIGSDSRKSLIDADAAEPAPLASKQFFQRAVKEFLDKLPDTEKEALRLASQKMTEERVLNDIKQYDQKHRSGSSMRKHSDILSKFFAVLNRFTSTIAICMQANPDPSAIIIGITRAVVTIAIGFVGFFDKLSDMINRVGDYLAPLSAYAVSAANDRLIEDSLANVYIDLLTFWRSARAVFVDSSGNTRKWTSWRVFWRVQWMPFEEEFQSIDNSIQHHLNVLSHATRAVTLEKSLEAHQREMEARRRESTREREQFLTWLSGYPFEDAHSTIYAKRHPGTGNWLLEHAEYERWFKDVESSILWCYGKPGAGKSVLASNVIEDVTRRRALDPHVGIAFAYYKYEITQMQDSTFIMAALIKQLCRRTESVPEGFLRTKYDAYPPSHISNVVSLLKAAEHYDLTETFVIIDALDECPKGRRPEILKCLREIVAGGRCIKLFITSRPETDIRQAIEQLKAPKIRIEANSVQNDINLFVEEETLRLIDGVDGRKLYLNDLRLGHKIIETLSSKAEGMFLWAHLQLLHLCEESESQNDGLIEEALTALPRGLEATYQRSLSQICQQNEYRKQIAFLILKWIVYAERPLTTQEIHDVLLSEERRYKGQPLDHNFILATCANLLEVIRVDAGESTFVLRLIHYSVKEFIIETASSNIINRSLLALRNQDTIQTTMATTCINYVLAQLKGAEPCRLASAIRKRLTENPFLWYAAKWFDTHIAKGDLSDDLVKLIETVLQQPSSVLSSILQVRAIRQAHMQAHIPSLWDTSNKLFLRNADPKMVVLSSSLFEMKAFDHYWKGQTLPPDLLPFACAAGMEGTVHYLLTAGVDVNVRDEDGVTGLWYAADTGNVEIVRLLIDHNVHLDCVCSVSSGTALQAATVKCNVDIVRLMIEAGADPNVQGGQYENALQAACFVSCEQIVQLLLKAGGDGNVQSGHYGNPLQIASQSGHKNIMCMLLDADANINAVGGFYGSALAAAINAEAVELLLLAGANPNIVEGYYGTPLQKAVKAEDEAIARLLLQAGAAVNIQSEKHPTPLHLAVQKRNTNVVKLLIESGADVNACMTSASLDNHTPLQLAIMQNRIYHVEPLLNAGADPNIHPGQSDHALKIALHLDNPSLVPLLIRHGADPSAALLAILDSILHEQSESFVSDYFVLGRCLLLTDHVDDFKHICNYHWAACDRCERTVTTTSFVCSTCIVIDLCARCMARERAQNGPCTGHEFIEVRYREELAHEIIDDELVAWLRNLRSRLNDDSTRGSGVGE